ncbi:MAG: hydrogenase maturation nickel metallochaperone HypA [Planctomycetota bacterium]
MHELSIANSLVTLAVEAIESANESDVIVDEVHVRVGALAGVVKEALHFCYDMATERTPLEGSTLVVHELPVVVFCPSCAEEIELPSIQRFRCTRCDQPTADIRQGQELELQSIHFKQASQAPA